MANFIKNNLLGSLREFRNRFINPIQNGQCADSTSKDVRLMKKRAHVLHAMLAGCVQVENKDNVPSAPIHRSRLKAVSLSAEERLFSAGRVSASQTGVRVSREDHPAAV